MNKFILMKVVVLTMTFATSTMAFTLKVNVTNLRNDKGTIKYLVFNNEKGFPDILKHSLKSGTILATETEKGIVLENLEAGSYSVSVIHDENNNDKLDTNFLGMPKEGFGFSNNPTIYFGPPSFNKSKVELEKDSEITIKLKYF